MIALQKTVCILDTDSRPLQRKVAISQCIIARITKNIYDCAKRKMRFRDWILVVWTKTIIHIRSSLTITQFWVLSQFHSSLRAIHNHTLRKRTKYHTNYLLNTSQFLGWLLSQATKILALYVGVSLQASLFPFSQDGHKPRCSVSLRFQCPLQWFNHAIVFCTRRMIFCPSDRHSQHRPSKNLDNFSACSD